MKLIDTLFVALMMATSNALCVTGYMVSRKKLAQNVRAPCVGVYVCDRLNMTNWIVNKY